MSIIEILIQISMLMLVPTVAIWNLYPEIRLCFFERKIKKNAKKRKILENYLNLVAECEVPNGYMRMRLYEESELLIYKGNVINLVLKKYKTNQKIINMYYGIT